MFANLPAKKSPKVYFPIKYYKVLKGNGNNACSEKNEMVVFPLFRKEKSTFISVESTPYILCMYWVYIISKLGQVFCTK